MPAEPSSSLICQLPAKTPVDNDDDWRLKTGRAVASHLLLQPLINAEVPDAITANALVVEGLKMGRRGQQPLQHSQRGRTERSPQAAPNYRGGIHEICGY